MRGPELPTITVTVQWPTDLSGSVTRSGTDYVSLIEGAQGTVGATQDATVLSTSGPVSDRVSTLSVTFPTIGQLPSAAANNLVLQVNNSGIVGKGQQPIDWFLTPLVAQLPETPWAAALPVWNEVSATPLSRTRWAFACLHGQLGRGVTANAGLMR